MLKNISNLGKALNKIEQKEINGGARGLVLCLNPYLTPDNTCAVGYHLHPQGHCICCRD
jgi:hypothetical protein